MSDRNLLGDRYELGDVLGRGGMAEVRYGRDRRLGRAVAVKMLRVDHAIDPTFQERFRREAQSAASLNHRNIVAVYDTGEDFYDGNSIPYIVMEYVEGRTLRDLVQERIRFTPERSIEVTGGILDALEYSHRAGIVHRDIKPANVMINNAGEVKVMDFGIARSLAETGAALTQTAAVVGTAQYISPEQARGESADARSDLYAVGCVIYELLTGRPPFIGESLVSVAVSHVREMATPPSALDPSIPRDMDSVVLKSLAKDRNERYQSASEMRADLERVAAGLPVSAQATAATQFIGASPGYTDTSMYDQNTAGYDNGYDDYDDEDDDDRRGMSWGALVGAGLAILAAALLIGYLVFNNDGGEQPPQAISAPDLLGLTLAEAQALPQLADANITIQEGEPIESQDEGDFGKIQQQDPAQGELVQPGGVITVRIAVGPEQASVPNLEGMTQADAEAAIQAAGLAVGTVAQDETDDENLVGKVKEQSPAAGESVDQGTSVSITVYTEPGTVTVPGLINRTRDEAIAELTALGFVVGDNLIIESEDDPNVDENIVIRTEPQGGTEVDPDSDTITVVVSTGESGLITVPDVVNSGHTAATVDDAFEDIDLTFNIGDAVQDCEATTEGDIVDQNPAPNTEVEPGTNVTVIPVTTEGCEDDGGG
jgi:serine/threonine-protein kinase